MAEIKLHSNDNVRIVTDKDLFFDVSGMEWEAGIRVTGYVGLSYIEVRKKDRYIATFYFKNKRQKKDTNLGWWEDAEVVYSINEVNK